MTHTLADTLAALGASTEYLPTGELAARLGITVDTLKKWKRRGFIPSGPKGHHGAGTGNENMWSPQAQQEAFTHRSQPSMRGYNLRSENRAFLAKQEPNQ